MINILITEIGRGYGGSGSYLYSFLKFLDRAKFNPCVVFYYYAEGPAVKRINDLGVEIIYLGQKHKRTFSINKSFSVSFLNRIIKYFNLLLKIFLEDLPNTIKLTRIIRKKRIFVALLNSEVYVNIPAVLASQLTGILCIVRKSGTGADNSRKIRRISSAWVDYFIASSEYEAKMHRENKFPYKKMEVVYEGVDIDRFKPQNNFFKVRNEFNLISEDFIVGSISRIDDGKGHDDLLRAAEVVVKKDPRIQFLIVGDDCGLGSKITLNQLKNIARELGIQNNIIFAGWRNDIPDVLQAIDIFVHCPNTFHEGMGIATLEAQASGKPVIVTKNAGLAETTIDGFNGFVIPVGDYLTLADKIILLSQDKELKLRMGINSRRNIESRFDMRRTVAKIEEITYDLIRSSKVD